MSWGFEGDQYLAISIETRKEKGEQYSALRGFFRQYELTFVVADERDVVRLRTNFRGEDVYVYRLDAPPADALVAAAAVPPGDQRAARAAALVQRADRQLHHRDPAPRRGGWPAELVELEALPQRPPRRAGLRHRRVRSLASVPGLEGEEPHQRAGQGRRRRSALLGPHPGRAPADVAMITCRARRLARLAALGLALAACAGPVGSSRTDPKVVLRDVGRSATTTGEPSWSTRTCSSSRGCSRCSTSGPRRRSPRSTGRWSRPGAMQTCSSRWPSYRFCTGSGASRATAWRPPSTRTPSCSRTGRGARRDASIRASGSPRTCTTGR